MTIPKTKKSEIPSDMSPYSSCNSSKKRKHSESEVSDSHSDSGSESSATPIQNPNLDTTCSSSNTWTLYELIEEVFCLLVKISQSVSETTGRFIDAFEALQHSDTPFIKDGISSKYQKKI